MMNDCFCCVRFSFLSIRQEIGWEDCLQSDLFCVKQDVKPLLNLLVNITLSLWYLKFKITEFQKQPVCPSIISFSNVNQMQWKFQQISLVKQTFKNNFQILVHYLCILWQIWHHSVHSCNVSEEFIIRIILSCDLFWMLLCCSFWTLFITQKLNKSFL